tara:strand:+ start:5482 stop:6078 length:597 start_codon:yes stop_codon:yes gene_type:complete
MVSKSNNNIILIVLIFFIIIVLCINYSSCKKNDENNNENDECTTCTENFTDTSSMNNKKPRIKFNKTDNVKYFYKEKSPSDIPNIPEEKEQNTIEEFDYDVKLMNDVDNLKINRDSTKLVSYDEINNDDKISEKFNKLIGNVDTDITVDNLKLIQGKESEVKPTVFKSQHIYNNSLTNDSISNNNKYTPFSGNNYRSI